LSSRPLRLAYLGFALLGAAVLGAFVYDRAFKPRPAPPPAPTILAPRPAAAPAPSVPDRRPELSLKDLDGRMHTLAEWDGKALIINFWATWCAPCRHEIPLLNAIRSEYAAKGVEIVGIAVDFPDDVRAFTKEFPISYPLLTGEDEGLAAARAFGVETMAFPFSVFTDRAGRVITLHLGELHRLQAQVILGIIARVDAGELTPEAGRSEVAGALKALASPPNTVAGAT
jgi:thiol-disulfide isomerase/thioredoxin